MIQFNASNYVTDEEEEDTEPSVWTFKTADFKFLVPRQVTSGNSSQDVFEILFQKTLQSGTLIGAIMVYFLREDTPT